jgi:quercetin dioxygenase-like cupin family protein
MTLPTHAAPKVLRPGEGKYVTIAGTTRCTFKVVGEDTGGHFGLFEYEMNPGAQGASPHVHHKLTEIFYVAEGEVVLRAGEERIRGRPGTTVVVPPETVHAFENGGAHRSVLLILFCPADRREGYFEGLAELTKNGRLPSREELLALMRRFDQEPVEQG